MQKADRSTYMLMDALRFAAALAVVLNHARSLLLVDSRPGADLAEQGFYFFTGFGHQGVIIFFVLSGFWISKSVATRIDRPAFWTGYLIARLSRLWIVLIPALVLGGVLDAVGRDLLALPIYASGNGSSAYKPPADLGALAFIGNAAFLQTLLVPVFGSNGPLWSVAFEFWFYIWFPALLLLGRKRLSLALIAVPLGVAFPALIVGFGCWSMGSALYFASERAAAHPLRPVPLAAMAIAGLGLVGLAAIAGRLSLVAPILSDLALAAGVALILFASLAAKCRYGGWLAPFARYGARSSYSLYAIHFPIVFFVAALNPARAAPSLASLALFLAVVALALVSGWGFSRLTEANTDGLRLKLTTRFASA